MTALHNFMKAIKGKKSCVLLHEEGQLSHTQIIFLWIFICKHFLESVKKNVQRGKATKAK